MLGVLVVRRRDQGQRYQNVRECVEVMGGCRLLERGV